MTDQTCIWISSLSWNDVSQPTRQTGFSDRYLATVNGRQLHKLKQTRFRYQKDNLRSAINIISRMNQHGNQHFKGEST